MRALFDFLDNFIYGPLNYLDRIEGLFKAGWYQDTGHRFAMPRIDKGGRYDLRQVETLLNRYGVAVFCRTYDANNRYFRVKKRQARWAEYILLHAGVELRGPLYDPRNAHYVAQHPPGWMPQPWSEQQEIDDDEQSPFTAAAGEPNEHQSDQNDDWRTLKKLLDW